jgi:serine/threonine protein kinase/tetratricopeptide (TPR) repeat protein
MRSTSETSGQNAASFVASLMGRDDSRVVRALEEYLEAVDQGQPPHRTDFLLRYASIAERLAECLDGLEMLRSAAGGFSTKSHPAAPVAGLGTLALGGRLGDYQILREVGRGGMGVVYEAMQVSLGRRVALKVLPAAHAIDQRQLQRFRVEARAAAQLHHSNIVPVFAVDCDQSVHYYAMQFIDGPTLAEVIRALKDSGPDERPEYEPRNESSSALRVRRDAREEPALPRPIRRSRPDSPRSTVSSSSTAGEVIGGEGRLARFRAAARLGVQAARALDHAHRIGVVHRDIKPANLMIDLRGNLWITDFGLARIQEDTGLTITGDLLGTLRYMSPEQASGRRAIVDHRADIYALGTTLYEFVTLRPAIHGRDRHELIRQITQDEPERPRRIDPRVPRELETIVLKAMAREPADRYATANDMANDLQRFLEDKPILARAPNLLDRSAKFARRHRTIVFAACVLLLLAAVFLGISTFHIARRLDFVEQQRRGAVTKLKRAFGALDIMHNQMVEKWLALEPEKALQQNEVLTTVLEYYQDFTQEQGDDAELATERALAYRRIGDIQYRLGRPDEAETAYRMGLFTLDRLAANPACNPAALAGQASQICKALGRLLHATIRDSEAEELMRRAIVYQKRFVDDPRNHAGPEANGFLAGLYLDLGLIQQRMGRYNDAIGQFRTALRDAQATVASPDLDDATHQESLALVASIESHLAQILGDPATASTRAMQSVDILAAVMRKYPTRLETRALLAKAYFRRAWLLASPTGCTSDEVEAAVILAKQAIELEPFNASYHHQLGVLLLQTGLFREAERAFRNVLKLVPDSPDAHNSLAWILVTYQEPKNRRPRQAVALAGKAVSEAPQVGLYWNTLGVAHYENGEPQKAVAALERSMSLRGGGDSFDWYYLALSHWSMGRSKDARYWLNRATNWMNQNRPHDPELQRFNEVAHATIAGRSVSPTSTASSPISKTVKPTIGAETSARSSPPQPSNLITAERTTKRETAGRRASNQSSRSDPPTASSKRASAGTMRATLASERALSSPGNVRNPAAQNSPAEGAVQRVRTWAGRPDTYVVPASTN